MWNPGESRWQHFLQNGDATEWWVRMMLEVRFIGNFKWWWRGPLLRMARTSPVLNTILISTRKPPVLLIAQQANETSIDKVGSVA